MDEQELERRALALMQHPYHKVLHGSRSEGFFAEVLELPGCWTDGDTEEDALRNLEEAMTAWLMTAIEHGDPVPAPLDDDGPCRSVALPEKLYRRLVEHARKSGLSPDVAAGQLLADALVPPRA